MCRGSGGKQIQDASNDRGKAFVHIKLGLSACHTRSREATVTSGTQNKLSTKYFPPPDAALCSTGCGAYGCGKGFGDTFEKCSTNWRDVSVAALRPAPACSWYTEVLNLMSTKHFSQHRTSRIGSGTKKTANSVTK